ncbi:MAG: single-stranded DNA-binding protein [Clostridia bacterium]|nr:single-stranded DNA-binding protein [Clostridia bacterium]
MLNCAAIVGRLVADPELHKTNTGVSVCSFTVAVDRSFVRQGEERQADFIDIVAWRNTAEFICRYFTKGSLIAIDGSIQTRNYEDRNGNKRKSTEIIANNVHFCGPKAGDSNGGRMEGAAVYQPEPSFSTVDEGDFKEIPEDDLPF